MRATTGFKALAACCKAAVAQTQLLGGADRDKLTSGADVFCFGVAMDSPCATSDGISDFTHRLAKSAHVAGPIAFRGTGPIGAGDIGMIAATSTIVMIDLNGDQTTDMQIVLTGTIARDARHVVP